LKKIVRVDIVLIGTVIFLQLKGVLLVSINEGYFEDYANSKAVQYVHDKEANTLIVEDIGTSDLNNFVNLIKYYAYQHKIAKISIKIKESAAVYFFQHGFKIEASILAYYGLQDAFYIAYYLKDSYLTNQFEEKHDAILDATINVNNQPILNLEKNLSNQPIEILSANNQFPISPSKQFVFSSREVPTPKKQGEKKFSAKVGNTIAATATAYLCNKKKVVEFSEFTVNSTIESTLKPDQAINKLINEMENYYASLDCKTVYTTVPASSLLINKVCTENEFEFGGRLMNESFFKGQLDSLNTWSKQL